MCNLRPWDREDFLQCTAKRRMIMVGDMSMHQLFNSLACLLSKDIQEGLQMPWEVRPFQLFLAGVDTKSIHTANESSWCTAGWLGSRRECMTLLNSFSEQTCIGPLYRRAKALTYDNDE